MPDFTPNHYIVRKLLQPSGNGLLQGAVALAIRNITNPGQTLQFLELGGQTLFTGTNGSSGGAWAFQRVTATPAGGTVLTPFSCITTATDPATLVEVRFSDTGALTGVSANGIDFHHLGIASQVGSSHPIPLKPTDANLPCYVGPGDCLILYALTALVAGSRASFGVRWIMAP